MCGGTGCGRRWRQLGGSGGNVSRRVRPDVGKSMSRYLVDRIEAHSAIDVHLNSQDTQLYGDKILGAVRLMNPHGERQIPCAGVFSLIGAEPSSDWLYGCAALDDHGFVLTDLALSSRDSWASPGRPPLPFETSRPGLFAVGDLRSGSMKRVAAAVGEGSSAVRSVHQYLEFER